MNKESKSSSSHAEEEINLEKDLSYCFVCQECSHTTFYITSENRARCKTCGLAYHWVPGMAWNVIAQDSSEQKKFHKGNNKNTSDTE